MNETGDPDILSTLDHGDPPSHRTSDYVEIGILAFMILVGCPLNAVALFRTWSLLSRAKTGHHHPTASMTTGATTSTTTRVTSRLTVFKLHLSIANLGVLILYAVSQISWLITYEFRGGDVVCRIMKFFHTFCFYATSNLVAAIALDRLWVMFYVHLPGSLAKHGADRRIRVCIWTAWIAAFACSIPQFFLWQTIEAWPEWFQCVTVWTATSLDATTTDTTSSMTLVYEKIYGGLHLALVFWSPALIIIACYALIVARFEVYEKRSIRQSSQAHLTDHLLPVGGSRKNNNNNNNEDDAASEKRRPAAGRSEVGPTIQQPKILEPSQLGGELSTSTTLVALPGSTPQASASFLCRPLLANFSVITLRRAKRRTMKKTAWLLLCYLATWSPYNIVALWRHYFDPAFENFFLDILYNLIVLNAVVNPLIYGL